MSSGWKLHFDRVEASGSAAGAWLFVLHGIFGAGRNWRTIASRVTRAVPGWGALLIDLRLHGASPAFEPPHTVEACASDLVALSNATGLRPTAMLGHSFGGKVALAFLSQDVARTPRPRQVWIMDSTPTARPAVGDAERMLRSVRALPAVFSSRREAIERLRSAGFSDRVAAWMTANLRRSGKRYEWRLDFDALESLLHDFFRADLWPLVEHPPAGTELHFVKATGSNVLSDDEAELLRSIGKTEPVRVHLVEGGHWLNADNPDAVVDLLQRHLPPARDPPKRATGL